MDGGDRAGYKQISKNTDAIIITSTMGATTGDWFGFEVISSKAALAFVHASGISNSSLITSGTSYGLRTWIGGGKTTGIKVSTKTTGHKVIAYNRILL